MPHLVHIHVCKLFFTYQGTWTIQYNMPGNCFTWYRAHFCYWTAAPISRADTCISNTFTIRLSFSGITEGECWIEVARLCVFLLVWYDFSLSIDWRRQKNSACAFVCDLMHATNGYNSFLVLNAMKAKNVSTCQMWSCWNGAKLMLTLATLSPTVQQRVQTSLWLWNYNFRHFLWF